MLKLILVTLGYLLAVLVDSSYAMGPSRPKPHLNDHPKLREAAKHPIHLGRSTGTVTPGGYSPAQIRHAYGFDQFSATGAGQTIAIVNAFGSGTAQSDLNTFSKMYNLPATRIQFAYPQGKPRQNDALWALETSLDVQWAHAIAPAATILLVVAKSATIGDLLGAVDYAVAQGATQVSMSWGTGEFIDQSLFDDHFSDLNTTFVAASGDGGTGVLWPAVSPHVVAVGGTSLPVDAAGNLIGQETAWGGSGGGTSQYVAQPAYQSMWQSSGKRMVPDVSYNADPYTGFAVYTSTPYNGKSGWFIVGGTSAGAPQWAALIALANSGRQVSIGAATHPALYTLSDPGLDTMNYRDIVLGCNSGVISWGTCSQTGYDTVTGVGSPLANYLTPALQAY